MFEYFIINSFSNLEAICNSVGGFHTSDWKRIVIMLYVRAYEDSLRTITVGIFDVYSPNLTYMQKQQGRAKTKFEPLDFDLIFKITKAV